MNIFELEITPAATVKYLRTALCTPIPQNTAT
jgi:hypothetical protein